MGNSVGNIYSVGNGVGKIVLSISFYPLDSILSAIDAP